MKIITRMIEDELYEASNKYGNKVMIDMREQGIKQSQSPVEMLLSSLAACGAVDIVIMLKKRKKHIRRISNRNGGHAKHGNAAVVNGHSLQVYNYIA